MDLKFTCVRACICQMRVKTVATNSTSTTSITTPSSSFPAPCYTLPDYSIRSHIDRSIRSYCFYTVDVFVSMMYCIVIGFALQPRVVVFVHK